MALHPLGEAMGTMTAMVEGAATLIGSATGVALAHSMGGHHCSMHQLGRQLATMGHRGQEGLVLGLANQPVWACDR